MKKTNLLALLLMFTIGFAKAQLSGVFSVPGSYTSVAATVNDLNTQGVNGAVTINIAAGYIENAPLGGYTLTATGTAANPITFQKSGVGANPLLTAYPGTGLPNTAIQDGIWRFIGSDYITMDGIDLADPNTSNPSYMEFGYGFFKASVTNGCQYNTIQNCRITLNRDNFGIGLNTAVDGSRGIDMVNALTGAHTTALVPTSVAGSNSFNKFYSNTIENCNICIALIGYAAATPFTFADYGNDVGGNSVATGNNLIDFGGGTAATNPAAGIRTFAQYNLNTSYNTINNNTGSGVNSTAIIRGIVLSTAPNANSTVSSNTITIKTAVTTAAVSMIENLSGGSGVNNTITITNNLMTGCTNTAATSSTWYGIYNSGANCANLNISGNTFTNNATNATTGSVFLIYNTGAVNSSNNLSNNTLSFNHVGTVGHTGTLYNIYNASSSITTTLNINNNNFVSYNHNVTGTGSIYFIYSGASNYVFNLNNNAFNNLTLNHSGSQFFMYNLSSTQYALSVASNSITNITRNAAANTTYCYYSSASSLGTSTQTIANNLISNITATAVAGSGSFFSFYNSDGSASPYPQKTIFNNTVTNINYNSTGSFYGMYTSYLGHGTATSGTSIYNNKFDNITWNGYMYVMYVGSTGSPTYPTSVYTNTISNLTSNGPSAAIYANYLFGGSAGLNFYKNKTYNIKETGTSGILYGMYLSSPLGNIYNNIIGNISTPNSNGANQLIGIYVAGGTTSNLSFNSIYLNGSSTGANFGSSALYASTGPNLNLRNNILVNNCTPAGTGFSVVYRRSSNALATYSATSDNNLFYAGVPSASKLIYFDGTTPQQTLSGFQAVVSPRDAVSITENPPFVSIVGSNPNFLNINAVTPTQIESGAAVISTITDDYIGTIRNTTTPDIGAWEGNFTPLICSGSPSAGISSISSATGCPNLAFTLSNTGQSIGSGISLQWQSAPSASGPWTNIIGATAATYTLISPVTTFYQFVVTCTNSALSATTAPVSYSVVNPGPCICNSYGSSNASFTTYEDIFNVTFSTLTNTSNCTSVGPGPGSLMNQYSNYSGFVTAPSVFQGQSVPFSFQSGNCTSNTGNCFAAYIDYNQNGSFADAGEQVYLSSAAITGPNTVSGNITVPLTASVGITRMRVINMMTTVPSAITPTGIYNYGETEDYCVDIQALLPCSGTPTTGIATINTPTGCPNVVFSLNALNVTYASGISYQWQSAPSASGPWTSIPTATNTSYNTTATTTTYYQLETTCANSSMTNTTSVVSFSMVNPGPCTCMTYGLSNATSTFDEELLNVTFGTLNNTSNCTSVGPGPGSMLNQYSNYSGFVTPPTVLLGQQVPFSFQIGTCNGNYNSCTAAYIDYNHNGLFTDAGEQVYLSTTSTNGPYIVSGTMTIPTTASVGVTRMRVINMETGSPSAIVPVGTYGYGETEDYCVDIQPLLPCSGTPASGTAAIGSSTGCINDPINLITNGAAINPGITYQWQSSTFANGPWTNIAGATNVTYSTTSSVPIFFQMVTTCTLSTLTATSSVVSYTPFNCYSMANTTVTTCGSTIYDSGGNSANYQNNESYTMTILPSAAFSSVTITFNNFNIESGFDFLSIHDGTSTAAPLIGLYTGNSLPPMAMATNSAGALTLNFTSDPTTTLPGFQAVLNCTSTCMVPPAPTVSGSMAVCSGNSATLTTNTSATATTKWYATPVPFNAIATGTMFITPTLTNNTTYYVRDSSICGTSTLVAVNITVNPYPTLPVVSGATICSGNSTTLSAIATGTVQWYATSTATAPIATGTLYTTPVLNNNTTYYVRDTTACGVTTLVAISVSVNTTPTLGISSTGTAVCFGSSVTLTAMSMTNYTWSTASTNTSIVVSPTVMTTYTVEAYSSLCNISQTASITLPVHPLPTVSLNASGITTICATNGSISLVGSPSGGVYSGIGVTNNKLAINNPGIFTPVYTYTDPSTGCSNSAATSVTVVLCSGTGLIVQGASINFNVMPNPNSGIFNIETGTFEMKSVQLSDVTGRIVYSDNSDLSVIQVNINELANGVYYLRVTSPQGTNIMKVIKQ